MVTKRRLLGLTALALLGSVTMAAAQDAFFTDDRLENVEGAASIGITAHLYRDAAGLLAAIEAFAAEAAAA